MFSDVQKQRLFCSQRLLFAFVFSLGIICVYGMRVNMSVAIVCMVNHTAVRSDDVTDMHVIKENTTEGTSDIVMPKCLTKSFNNTQHSVSSLFFVLFTK